MSNDVDTPPQDEVQRLVSQAAAGDTRAFEMLYRLHLGRVYALCLRLTRNDASAEELTQSAFVRAWQKLSSFRGESAFSTWLYRLTVNVVFESQRSDQRRAGRVVAIDDLASADRRGYRETPGIKVDLEQAIAKLPDRAREVFVLFQVEGYSHVEISNFTGMAVGSSKAQLHRARHLLREMLDS
ncbi:MAG: sigma-70 family RNA polymerase sigma factor [Candidatus Latescibacteria bacterium]|jgi:RNA polymerase sigma factor (sigma-70 family)|nr:sigma-70 family RNA polymerase sigma factor [Candidatus Latescibacterota bacterium]MBT5831270.1 sigma-70 family RNA polymerase sigma factor [Candidatus Latescibacterota bacterium]